MFAPWAVWVKERQTAVDAPMSVGGALSGDAPASESEKKKPAASGKDSAAGIT